MARRFERAKDILREQKAMRLFLGDDDRFRHVKLGSNEIDFEIKRRGQLFGYAEIKGVEKVPSVYSEHKPIVAIQKLTSLQRYVNERNCEHVYIIWAYSDGIKYAKVKDLKGEIRWGGRKSRDGSVNDQELLFVDRGTEFRIKTYD